MRKSKYKYLFSRGNVLLIFSKYFFDWFGNNLYAFYAHCVPNSFLVNTGDAVQEGQPLALLGNSGNSDAPHLHFEITDGFDILFSNGVPFVLKHFIKQGVSGTGPVPPVVYQNSMMEEETVIGF